MLTYLNKQLNYVEPNENKIKLKYDKIKQNKTKQNKIWQDMTKYDKIWQNMTKYDKKTKSLC